MGTRTTSNSLRALLENIDSRRLVLPEIQREFVWSKKNVLQLFDSLYRGFPIGFMLLWKTNISVAQGTFANRTIKVGQTIDNFYGYLLDGQQRLTAVQHVKDRHDKYQMVFSLWPDDEEEPEKDRFNFRTRRNDNVWHILVADVLSEDFRPLKVVENLKEDEDFDYETDAEKILASLTKLKAILDYKIGIIEFEDDDYRKATELFIRFNSTGVKLKSSDLAAAELALSVPELISNGIKRISQKYYPNFTFTRPFLIQCLAAIHTSKMRFAKSRDIWDGSNEIIIKNSWKKTEKGIERVIELLTGTVKWNSLNWLPSINSIIPLVYLLSNKQFNNKELVLARKWLLLSNIHAYFSGSVHSELDRLLRGLKKDKSIKKLWTLTRRDLPELKPDDFDTHRKSGGAMSFYISMIRNIEAKDWERNTPLDGNVIGHNSELQIHHFFPKALLKNKGYDSEEINTFCNYVIINKNTNLKFSSKEPYKYIKEYKIKNDHLEKQCIPTDPELWKTDNYENFQTERRKLLSKQANLFIKNA